MTNEERLEQSFAMLTELARKVNEGRVGRGQVELSMESGPAALVAAQLWAEELMVKLRKAKGREDQGL